MRYLNLGTVSAQASQAVYHALATLMPPEGPITLVTVSPDEPYVCVGYHQVASREIDRETCEREGVPVGRRMVGGGAVYLDHNQVFWHLVMPGTAVSVESLYNRLLPAPVMAYQRMGIPALHRPVNDIVVGARKIGGTGAAAIGEATVLVGSLMMDFDSRAMARLLRVPSEKFRDKIVASLSEYMTTVKRELGEAAPTRESATAMLVEAFAEVTGEKVDPSELTERERTEVRRFEHRLFDPDFVYRREGWLQPGLKIKDGVRVLEGVQKAPGGLIRFIYRLRDDVFDDVLLSGDFFVDPPDGLARLERALVGRPATEETVGRAARALLEEVAMPRIEADDFVHAFAAAQMPVSEPR